MGLLDTIKSWLGLGGGDERREASDGDVGVTVERDTRDADEPRTTAESAVKAPADEAGGADQEDEDDAVAAGTDASASTGSMVDEDPDTAAEPAEAAGVGGDDGETTVDTEPPETDDAAAAGSEAAASTGSMVDENVADEAAEPAEAVDVDVEDADDPERAGSTESPEVLKGIGPAYAQRLADAGIETVSELAAADADEVGDAIDVSPKRVGRWIDRAKEY
jgi:predicted flap endonuclease-1-like 5' DNA nuclease